MAELTIKASMDATSVETGMERIKQQADSLKSGSVGGAFKALAQDLASASGPAEMLSMTMNRLATTLKGTMLGAAGLAIGKLLAAPFEQLSTITQAAADSARSAIDAISKSSGDLTFDQAVAQAQSLQVAIDKIGSTIQQIDSNPFLRMADAIIGASKELKLLQGALENVASKQIAMGALVDANNAEALVGKTGDERQRMQIQLDAKAKRERAKNETTSVQDRDSAIADINREEAAKLKDLDMQKAKKAKEDEEKLREGALKTLDQIFKVEEKIRQGRMKEPELAEELIKKYEELNGMQELFASFGSAEGAKQAAQFGLEAAQIKEQLAGLGQGTTSQEIIADSIQRVGGGGRSAIIGGQGQIDYLKRLNDTGDKQYKTLMTIANNTSPSDRGMAGAQ